MPHTQPEKWTREFVEQKLQGLPPVTESDESGDADLNWAYRKSAAVLSSFLPRRLQPTGTPLPDEEAALGQLLADSNLIYDEQNKPYWTLRDEIRIEALRRLGSRRAMQAALEKNSRPRDPLQKMLSAYILNQAPPLSEQNLEELSCTLQVTEWLSPIVTGLPEREEVRQRIGFENLLKPFRFLVGTHFRGRSGELQQLRDYVGSLPTRSTYKRVARFVNEVFNLHEKPPLLIYGPGGMGKSTLLAKFILEHAELGDSQRFPFAYIDFDRPGLMVERPLTILLEAIRQLGIQYPRTKEACESLARKWRQQMSSSPLMSDESKPTDAQPYSGTVPAGYFDHSALGSDSESPYSDAYYYEDSPSDSSVAYELQTDEFRTLLEEHNLAHKYFLLVLDTFEEAQYRSKDYVAGLWHFLSELQRKVPRLRTVLAGRAPISEFKVEPLLLDSLDAEAAQGFLQAHGIKDTEFARVLAEQLRGNPLSLKLAVELIRKEQKEAGKGGIKGLETHRLFFFNLKEERIQGQLFKRILKHIHDEDVRKLAHPGLVLRRVTAELIEQVLAKPCGVEVKDHTTAVRLFDELSKEVSLVAPAEHGALRHRTDVRRVMIDLLKEDEKDKVEQIHKSAVDYYRKQEGAIARAEEIYHRLSLGQSPRTIDGRWMDGVEDYLGNAIEELPTQQKAYLASRLGLVLDEEIFATADLEVWERHTEKKAQDLLNLGKPKEALKVIRARQERTAGSPLYLLEAQALERIGDYKVARSVAERGISSAVQKADELMLLNLLLLSSRLDVRSKNYKSALESLNEAQKIAQRIGNDLLLLEIYVGTLRLLRFTKSEYERFIRTTEVIGLFNRIPDHQLAQNPELLRTLASLLGAEYPEVMRKALRLVGLGPLGPFARLTLISALTIWDTELSKEAQEDGVLIRSARLKKDGNISQTWRSFINGSSEARIAKVMDYLLANHLLTQSAANKLALVLIENQTRNVKPIRETKNARLKATPKGKRLK